jgi:Undecaprenyl-phosphate glucose phosphotransferase
MELNDTMGLSQSVSQRSQHEMRLQPQHLGYLSFIFDLVLFVAACGSAAAWVGTSSQDLFHLCQILVGTLLVAIFAASCYVFRVHAAAKLVTDQKSVIVTKALICFGAPPLVALAICTPYLWSGNPAVIGFLAWLKSVAMFAVTFAIASRLIFIVALPRITKRLVVPHRIAVVGSGESARRLLDWINVTAPRLVEVVGVFDDRGGERLSGTPLADLTRGSTADLIELYKRSPFDKVIIALPHSAEARVLNLLRRLRQLPVDIVLAPDLIGFHGSRAASADIAGLKLNSLADRPIREPQRLIKGAIDRMLAALALIFLSPLLVAVSIAIKLDSRGPVLFRQPRQGLGDTLFEVFKFRTMHQGLGDTIGQQQTKREDPRITRLGAFLRRSSIDELPQLLNVLRGEMSLVGPRPHTPHMLIGDKRIFDLVDEYSFRHRVKPGITGLAQVHGFRGAIDTPEQLRARVDYDLYYIDHWSLWLDFKIMFKTAAICVTGVNAF